MAFYQTVTEGWPKGPSYTVGYFEDRFGRMGSLLTTKPVTRRAAKKAARRVLEKHPGAKFRPYGWAW